MSKQVYVWEAVGILSGDHERFCLAATREECIRSLTETEGAISPRYFEYSENPFHEGLFNLYPQTFSRQEMPAGVVRYRVTVEIEPVEEAQGEAS